MLIWGIQFLFLFCFFKKSGNPTWGGFSLGHCFLSVLKALLKSLWNCAHEQKTRTQMSMALNHLMKSVWFICNSLNFLKWFLCTQALKTGMWTNKFIFSSLLSPLTFTQEPHVINTIAITTLQVRKPRQRYFELFIFPRAAFKSRF